MREAIIAVAYGCHKVKKVYIFPITAAALGVFDVEVALLGMAVS